ncbi:MAG: hypothetical protein AB9828_03215 [Sphaerochaetaceae bacterium]|jgi:hypothetical protein
MLLATYTEEERMSLVLEFFKEYQETKRPTTEFSRKKGINESTFLGWVRRYDTQGVYPPVKHVLHKAVRHDLVLVGPETGKPASGTLSIEYYGCTIRLGEQFTSEDLSKVLLAVKGVR